MNYKSLCVSKWPFVVAAILTLAQLATASTAPVVFGTYQVVQNTNLGSQTQIRMHIHLVNHGAKNLFIQRVTLWDFSHPDKGGTRACALTLRAHASADTTQEFTIRRPEFESWRKGLRPRLVLGMAAPAHTKSTAVVRLDRLAGQEAK
jgi:hypothetical protein